MSTYPQPHKLLGTLAPPLHNGTMKILNDKSPLEARAYTIALRRTLEATPRRDTFTRLYLAMQYQTELAEWFCKKKGWLK